MEHQEEYHDSMVQLLELVWGEGYMTPGGPGSVARMLDGLDTAGKRILDIGCGLGGPACEMAVTYGASVVGVDLEAPLVARANAYAAKAGLAERCRFQEVEIAPLPFDAGEVDIVRSAAALTQTEDKPAMLADILRVLRPGGWISTYDWMKTDAEYSDDMRYWFKMEGLTYAMVTLEEQAALLREAGFDNVDAADASDWYRREARREYDLLRGELNSTMIDLIGAEDSDHFIENWRAMLVVIDSGEKRQGYCRGQKPAARPGE